MIDTYMIYIETEILPWCWQHRLLFPRLLLLLHVVLGRAGAANSGIIRNKLSLMGIFMVNNFSWLLLLLFVVIDCIAIVQLIVVVIVFVVVVVVVASAGGDRLARRGINNGHKVSRQRVLRCKRR